ncbi:hypothetical protein N7463_000203, partial [Penicillium fimorum]
IIYLNPNNPPNPQSPIKTQNLESLINVQPNQQIRPHRRPSPNPTHHSLLSNTNLPPTPILETPPAQRINAYARTHLPKNHTTTHDGFIKLGSRSNGTDSSLQPGTLTRLSSWLANITRLSFEFFGDVLALRVLQNDTRYTQDEDGADVGVHGRDRGAYTCFGEATFPRKQTKSVVMYNIGAYPNLVHADTIKDDLTHSLRKRWSHCFAVMTRIVSSLGDAPPL